MRHFSLPLAILLLLLLVLVIPAEGAVCTAPSRCLTGQQALAAFGTGNYTRTSTDSCGIATDVTGARTPQYCYGPAGTLLPPSRITLTLSTTAPVRGSPAIAPQTTTSQPPVIAREATLATMLTTPATRISVAPSTPTLPSYEQPTVGILTANGTPVPVPYDNGPGKEYTGTGNASPLIIGDGAHRHIPLLAAGSPYGPLVNHASMPLIYLETDWNDNNQGNYFAGEVHAVANWTDFTTLRIAKDEKKHAGNFRYMPGTLKVKSLFLQVSRYPFANDPEHWQNEYIPGLVATGEAQVYHTDDDGYRYFRINFARVAEQNPGDPPYYSGTVPYEPGEAGQVTVLPALDIPFTRSSIALKKVNLAGLSVPFPASLITVPAGELTQGELGNPNQNMTLVCEDCAGLRAATFLETTLTSTDQRFWVRGVPIQENGNAGVPSIPVEVVVRRPHPCTTVAADIVVSLPSADIVWYMRPTYGEIPNHWYYPWGPPYGDPFVPQYAHMYEPPPSEGDDKAWYETLVDTFKDALNFFSWVMTQYSQVWNLMEDFVVHYVGDTLTIGWCSDHSECTTALKTGLQAVMYAYGIPPTLPTGPELMDLSTDYMVKLGADQLGAGELYDAYKALPDEGKQALKDLKGKAQENAQNMAEGSKESRYTESLKYRCFFDPQFTCTHRVPDPIFSSNHPATVMVWVTNPAGNPGPTDRVLMTVADSRHVFSPAIRLIPPLAPGESVSVPVVLSEDYSPFLKANGGPCDPNAPSTSFDYTSSYDNLSTCLQGAWLPGFLQAGNDTFTVTFSNGKNAGTQGTELAGLDEHSNGKPLSTSIVVDPDAVGACGISHSVRFPPGWTITTPSYAINLQSWDYLFGTGSGGKSKTSGMLRNKP